MANVKTEKVSDNMEKLFLDEKPENVFDMIKNLKDTDMIRGATPENIEKRCLELCQTYIGGSWLQTNDPSDVTVSRITGGVTNQLYKCSLNDSVKRVKNAIYLDEPSAVAIKLYQSKHAKNYREGDGERLSDTISLTILSQTGLGPKIYGIFHEGVVQEFIDNALFSVSHQNQPNKVQQLIQKLAHFHHLNVPIRKNHNWILEEMQQSVARAFKECNAQTLIEELKLETLGAFDIRQEYLNIVSIRESLKSPQVFSHNDFRKSNILVSKFDGNIFLVDAEYCGYGDRAMDIATLLNEWSCEPLDVSNHGMPTDSVILDFGKTYIQECDKLMPGYATKPENSLETIVKEVKVNFLIRWMFACLLTMSQTKSLLEAIPYDPKTNLQFVEFIYKRYWEAKQRLIRDGTL